MQLNPPPVKVPAISHPAKKAETKKEKPETSDEQGTEHKNAQSKVQQHNHNEGGDVAPSSLSLKESSSLRHYAISLYKSCNPALLIPAGIVVSVFVGYLLSGKAVEEEKSADNSTSDPTGESEQPLVSEPTEKPDPVRAETLTDKSAEEAEQEELSSQTLPDATYAPPLLVPLPACATIDNNAYQHVCFNQLSRGEIQRAAITVIIDKQLTGIEALPYFKLEQEGLLSASFKSIKSDKLQPVRLQSVQSTLDFIYQWVEKNYATYSDTQKAHYIQSALLLAGFESDNTEPYYPELLSCIKTMIGLRHQWTEKAWLKKVAGSANRIASNQQGVSIAPIWIHLENKWQLSFDPLLDGKRLKGNIDRYNTTDYHLPRISAPANNESYLHQIKPSGGSCGGRLIIGPHGKASEQQVSHNTEAPLPCGLAYALGRDCSDLDLFFIIDDDCDVRHPWYDSSKR